MTPHLVGVFVIVWCRTMHVGAGLAPWLWYQLISGKILTHSTTKKSCSKLAWPVPTCPYLTWPVLTCPDLSWSVLFWTELSFCLSVGQFVKFKSIERLYAAKKLQLTNKSITMKFVTFGYPLITEHQKNRLVMWKEAP